MTNTPPDPTAQAGEIVEEQLASCFCAKLDPTQQPCFYCNRITHLAAPQPAVMEVDREAVAEYIMADPRISLEEAFARHRIAERERCAAITALSKGADDGDRVADAFLVEWQREGETWVHAHADEPTAVDQARKMGGTCTPLFREAALNESPKP